MHRNEAARQGVDVKISGGISMRTLNEAAIDQIVAACNGDLRGALRALLLDRPPK